tara:strand:- start:472 stop:1089 length:618 start_codon:yes stop_codon:yes gene_type:complete
MKVLELLIDKKIERYNLPTQWSEVSISQYAKLMKVLENDTINEIELLVRTLEALLDIDAKILVKVPLKYLKEVYIELEPLTKEMPSNELKRVIEIDNIEYGFVDFDDLTLGEFADLDNYLQDAYDNMDSIFSVLYRPVTKRKGDKYFIEDYTLKDIAERREIFSNKMSIDTVIGALVFFCNIGRKFIESTVLSLERKTQELKRGV